MVVYQGMPYYIRLTTHLNHLTTPNNTLLTCQLTNGYYRKKGEKQLLLAPPCDTVLLGLAATFSLALGCRMRITAGATNVPETAFLAELAVAIKLLVLDTNRLISFPGYPWEKAAFHVRLRGQSGQPLVTWSRQ